MSLSLKKVRRRHLLYSSKFNGRWVSKDMLNRYGTLHGGCCAYIVDMLSFILFET